ncbi:MAG: hypothetical protein KC561_01790, partial [Myxococcales bacterium]|nr:hypothetical protein [Myxococcales bacterium]
MKRSVGFALALCLLVVACSEPPQTSLMLDEPQCSDLPEGIDAEGSSTCGDEVCEGGAYCWDEQCWPGCLSAFDCPSGYLCDTPAEMVLGEIAGE